MATKGDKRTDAARRAAEAAVDRLSGLGDVSAKGMFGGFGLFQAGVMFGLVDSRGVVHFRVDDETGERYRAAGATRHGSMPYYAVPAKVLARTATLRQWAEDAIGVAHANRPGSAGRKAAGGRTKGSRR